MTTDTIFQLIDRAAIARLKEFHYQNQGKDTEAKLASDEASNLEAYGDQLLVDILSGVKDCPVRNSLRFHNHGDVEDKQKEYKITTVFRMASKLAAVHAEYWDLQSDINSIKRLLNDAKNNGEKTPENILNSQFVSLQRKIDMCNQMRNEYIEKGDRLLKELVDGTERIFQK